MRIASRLGLTGFTHRGRAARLALALAGVLVVTVLGLAGWAPPAAAFEQWSEDRNSGNCATCHGNFRTAGYVSFKDGTPWGTSLHDGHRFTMLGGDCNTCHQPSGRFPVILNFSSGGTGFDPIACVGCHGREGDLNAGQLGAGLRQHHTNAGVAFCGGCHGDNDPALFTTVAESELPPYYDINNDGVPDTAVDDPAHPNKPSDSCNRNGSEAVFGPTGLDNDGDLFDDGADSDCVVADPDIALNPAALDFGTVTIGATVTLTSQIENVGTADLTVSGVVAGAGTSAEFSFTAPATPFVVPPGGSQTVSVTYAPVDVGTDSGTLEVTSDDPDEPLVTLALSGTGEAVLVGDINLAPAALDFGTVTIGAPSTLTAQIENLGTAPLTVDSIVSAPLTSPEFAFTAPGTPFTIPVGGSQAVTVTYTPVDIGLDTGALDIQSDDPDEPVVQLALSGTGAAPLVCDIDVSPLLLDFGSIVAGSSNTLNVSVGNLGSFDCIVDSLVVSGDPEFSLGAGAPALPIVLDPGDPPVDVPVTYSPAAAGSHSGTLSIGSNDPVDPVVAVDLAGQATPAPTPDINLDPVALDFGVVAVGDTAMLTSQVQNLGTADLSVMAVDLCAGTSTEFGFMPLAVMTIPPGGSETLSVTYTPVDGGTDSGCIAIASNDPDENPAELAVSGTGEVLAPDIDLAPVALDFGTLLVGDSATQSATISNLGTAPLTVDSIAAAPGTSAEFSFVAPATPFTIPVGGSQSVSVTYAPVDAGLDSGAIEIASDDPDEPLVELALSGAGEDILVPDINLDPMALAFGDILLGNMDTLTSQVQNLGTADLEILMVDLCVGTSTEFDFVPLAATVIPPGGAQTLSVTYTPADVGDDAGCIEIMSNDPDEPVVELGLSGTGIDQPPMLEVGIEVPGAINPDNRGVTPVKFYADRDLAFAEVTCGPAMAEPKRLNMEDFNDDGYMDVVGLFSTRDLGIACGDTTLTCQGTLADGTAFAGASSVFKTVGPSCKSLAKLKSRRALSVRRFLGWQ